MQDSGVMLKNDSGELYLEQVVMEGFLKEMVFEFTT